MTDFQLLREPDAAAYLALSPKTLSKWRCAGKGPNFFRLGTAVRYSIPDLEKFISNAEVQL
jgi:Helix-turn-helix domain